MSVWGDAVPDEAFSHPLHLIVRRGSRVRIYSISDERHRALLARRWIIARHSAVEGYLIIAGCSTVTYRSLAQSFP